MTEQLAQLSGRLPREALAELVHELGLGAEGMLLEHCLKVEGHARDVRKVGANTLDEHHHPLQQVIDEARDQRNAQAATAQRRPARPADLAAAVRPLAARLCSEHMKALAHLDVKAT